MTADRQSGGQASTPEAPAPEAAAAAGGTGSLPLTAVHRTDAWLDDCFDAAEAKLAALLHDGCASGVRGTQRSGPVPVCSLPRVDIEATLAGAAPRTVAAAQGAHIGGTPKNMQVSTSERSSVRPCQKVNIVKWQQTCRVRCIRHSLAHQAMPTNVLLPMPPPACPPVLQLAKHGSIRAVADAAAVAAMPAAARAAVLLPHAACICAVDAPST